MPVAARAVTAVDPTIDDSLFEPGTGGDLAGGRRTGRCRHRLGGAGRVRFDLPRPADLDSFLDRLFAGPVQYRALSILPLADDRVAEELPSELGVAFGAGSKDAVVVHDRAETLIVMGADRAGPGRRTARVAELPGRDGRSPTPSSRRPA